MQIRKTFIQIIPALGEPIRQSWDIMLIGTLAYILTWHMTTYPKLDFGESLLWLWMDLYVICCLLVLLPRRWRIATKIAFYLFMYYMGYSESFLWQRWFIVFSPQSMTMAMETTAEESAGFFKTCWESKCLWPTTWPWLCLLSIHVLLITLCYIINRYFHVKGIVKCCGVAMSSFMAIAILLTSLWTWIPQKWYFAQFVASSSTATAERISSGVFYSSPYRAVFGLKFWYLSQREMDNLAENMQELLQKSTIEVDSAVTCPEIVLVIGESYNRIHSQVYGYSLNTTPGQQRMIDNGEMVAFSNVVTPWNMTSNVFKNMLSTHSCDQEGNWTNGVLWPMIFKKAGFSIAFYTNQYYKSKRQNKADFNGSFFLNDERFDSLCFDKRNTKHYLFDSGLLRELQKDSMVNAKQVTILHLLGQHVPYADRVPDKHTIFAASDIHRPDLTEEECQMVANYDNATLYNDEILSRIINHYKKRDAIVIYFADHGDEVYDGNIGMYGRNHSAELTPALMHAEFEIPFEIWTSQQFRATRPELWQTIINAKDTPFMVDDLCHMLFGLAGIRTQLYDARRDLLSPSFNAQRPRLLKDGIGNYDEIMHTTKK